MSQDYIQLAMSAEICDSAWRKVRNDHTPWSVDVSRDELERQLLYHLIQCREKVLCGAYKPTPLRQFAMKKADGKQRIISAQYLKDKWVQRALLTVLEPYAEEHFHDDSYAYRPKRGVQLALNKARERIDVGLDWLVDADIKSFFASIPHKQLISVLNRFVGQKNTMKLIKKWLIVGADRNSFLSDRLGIAQGTILSPLFCNLYLSEFDYQLTRANIPFIRYADDFLLFSSCKNDAEKAQAHAGTLLANLGLRLHPVKTRVIRSDGNVKFLGENLPKPRR